MNEGAVHWIAWLVLIVIALSVFGMIAYARGPEHHRGDEIGTHGTKIVIVRTPA